MNKKELGNKIRFARAIYCRKHGEKMTQAMLADKIGLKRSQIGGIEGGRVYPSYPALLKIAEVLEQPLNYFGSTTDTSDDVSEVSNIPKELKDIGLEYLYVAKEMQDKDMPPEDVKKLMKLIEEFKKVNLS